MAWLAISQHPLVTGVDWNEGWFPFFRDSDVVEYPGPNHATSQLKPVGLVGSPPTSLRHLLGLLNSEILVVVDFIQCSCQLRPPSSGTRRASTFSIRKIWIKRDLMSLYFNFIYLSFICLFDTIRCGWEDVASRCSFWLVFGFPLAFAAVFGQALLALEGFCHISVPLVCVEDH